MRRVRVVGECVLRATGERLSPGLELDMDEDVAERLRVARCVTFLHADPPTAAEDLAPEEGRAEPAPPSKPKKGGKKPKGEP